MSINLIYDVMLTNSNSETDALLGQGKMNSIHIYIHTYIIS